MNVKRSVVAVAAAGGTAALVFGGTAASTAFTSQSPDQTARIKGATVGAAIDGGSFTASDLLPGDSFQQTVKVTNNSTVGANGSITLQSLAIEAGNPGSTGLAELSFAIPNVGTFTAAQLAHGAGPISLGHFAAGETKTYNVTITLASGAGNEWNGAQVSDKYSITMTGAH